MIGILTIKRWRYNWEIVNKFELLVDDWFGVVPSGVSLSETVLAGLRDAVVTIIDIIGLSKNGISQNLLVSQSFFPHQIGLVGGFKHLDYFPFHIWEVILPIDELHHFSRWLLHHQPVQYFGKKRQNCGEQEMMIIEWISLGFSMVSHPNVFRDWL